MDREKRRNEFVAKNFGKENILSEDISKELLEIYGIATTRPIRRSRLNTATQIARKIGYPVVMKIHSPDITHKTDVGGVVLNLEDGLMVQDGFRRMMAGVKEKAPRARIDGVTIQKMIDLATVSS